MTQLLPRNDRIASLHDGRVEFLGQLRHPSPSAQGARRRIEVTGDTCRARSGEWPLSYIRIASVCEPRMANAQSSPVPRAREGGLDALGDHLALLTPHHPYPVALLERLDDGRIHRHAADLLDQPPRTA